jgi:predicted transposase YbfD/YdcC
VAPKLLEGIELRDKVITGDALYAQRQLCQQIVGRGGEYLFVVKANQRELLDDIVTLFAHPPEPMAEAEQVNRHGDRQEKRRIQVSSALNEYSEWPHMAQVCRIERQRTRKGQVQTEVAYAVTSLWPHEASPERLLGLIRGHWRIENCLHWVRDVTLGEDRSQVRKNSTPEVMAGLRNTVIGLLRLHGATNIAAALRRHACHPEEALAVIGLSFGRE